MIDNFIKGPLTSILGLAAMSAAGYGWWIDHLTDYQASGLGLIGFCLLFMRDKLPDFIGRWLNKKIDDGKQDPPTTPLLVLGLLSLALSGFGQSTDAALTTQSNVIRNETVARENSKTRIADMFQALIDSKMNLNQFPSVTASGTDTYTATVTPAITAYTSGMKLIVKFTNANSTAATINLNSLGAKDIRKNVSTALSSGDIAAGIQLLLVYDGTNFQIAGAVGGGGSGTVTSAAMTVPSFLSVAGSPITTTGTFAVSLATQSANTIFAGPTSGGAATPTFRALVSADLPAISGSSITNTPAGDIAASNTQAAIDELDAEKAPKLPNVNEQTDDYTLVASDAGKRIEANKSTPINVTIPANASVAFPVRTQIAFQQTGAGLLTLVAAGGVTLDPTNGSLEAPGQNVIYFAEKVATNTWKIQSGPPSNAVPATREIATGVNLADNVSSSELNIALGSSPYISGRLYGTAQNYTATTTGALGANSIRATPFKVKRSVTINALVAEVTTVGSFNFRLAVYVDDGDAVPDAGDNLIVQTAELDGSTPAAPSLRTGSVSTTLDPGYYWLCIVTAGSITFRADAVGAWGTQELGLDNSSQATIRQPYYTYSFTYASFPSTFPGTATINTNAGSGTNAPIVWVKVN